jgi:hypothetical protein
VAVGDTTHFVAEIQKYSSQPVKGSNQSSRFVTVQRLDQDSRKMAGKKKMKENPCSAEVRDDVE